MIQYLKQKKPLNFDSESSKYSLIVDKLWAKYDINVNGALERRETKRLALEVFGILDSQFDQGEFNRAFKAMGFERKSTLEKEEIIQLLQNMR